MLDVALADERPTADDPSGAGAARGRQHHARPADAALKDLANPAGRQPERRAAVARARLCPRRANGREAREGFRTSKARSARCRSSCSGVLLKEAMRACDRGRRLRRRRRPAERIRDHRRAARDRARGVGADGRLAEGLGRKRGRARRLSSAAALRRTGRRPRKAGCARSRCATAGELKTRRGHRRARRR